MYEYTIKHSSGESKSNTDALSQLPLPDTPHTTPVPSEVILILEQIDSSPITLSQVHMYVDSSRFITFSSLSFCPEWLTISKVITRFSTLHNKEG